MKMITQIKSRLFLLLLSTRTAPSTLAATADTATRVWKSSRT